GKRLIHGHTPTNLDLIKDAIFKKASVIPLDNGCVFYNSFATNVPDWNLGNLLCLNLDTFELIERPYED
ncbi:MAG: hypothetical protein AAGI07_20305, partial [Bacteroidota bacterium]